MKLPAGIWYEQKRERYRVRLYRKGCVTHLSYHQNLEDALDEKERVTMTPATGNNLTRMINQTKVFYKKKPIKWK